MYDDYGQRRFIRENYPVSPFLVRDVELLTEIGRAINNPASQQAIDGMVAEMDAHSPKTGAHIRRVEKLGHDFAEFIGLPPLAVLGLQKMLLLHDQGKLLIESSILEGNTSLSPEEITAIFFHHPEDGAKIIRSQKQLPDIFRHSSAEVAMTHHESYDGSGYPKGYVADSTNIFGRLARIIDTLDVAANRGQYQRALGITGALALMNDPENPRTVGKFDPEILALITQANMPKRPFLLAERRPSGTAGLIQAL